MMDAGLAWIKSNGPKMYVCTASISSASVPSYTKITSTAALTGPITTSLASVSLADGDTSGRKLAVPQKASIAVTGSGTAARVCLVNSSGSAAEMGIAPDGNLLQLRRLPDNLGLRNGFPFVLPAAPDVDARAEGLVLNPLDALARRGVAGHLLLPVLVELVVAPVGGQPQVRQ